MNNIRGRHLWMLLNAGLSLYIQLQVLSSFQVGRIMSWWVSVKLVLHCLVPGSQLQYLSTRPQSVFDAVFYAKVQTPTRRGVGLSYQDPFQIDLLYLRVHTFLGKNCNLESDLYSCNLLHLSVLNSMSQQTTNVCLQFRSEMWLLKTVNHANNFILFKV